MERSCRISSEEIEKVRVTCKCGAVLEMAPERFVIVESKVVPIECPGCGEKIRSSSDTDPLHLLARAFQEMKARKAIKEKKLRIEFVIPDPLEGKEKRA
jgi:hypothetical protein